MIGFKRIPKTLLPKLAAGLVASLLLVGLWAPRLTLAAPADNSYNCGNYGEGTYDTACPATTDSGGGGSSGNSSSSGGTAATGTPGTTTETPETTTPNTTNPDTNQSTGQPATADTETKTGGRSYKLWLFLGSLLLFLLALLIFFLLWKRRKRDDDNQGPPPTMVSPGTSGTVVG